MYVASLSSSRSSFARVECASLKALIFRPSPGLSAKFRDYKNVVDKGDERGKRARTRSSTCIVFDALLAQKQIVSLYDTVITLLRNVQLGKVVPDDLEWFDMMIESLPISSTLR